MRDIVFLGPSLSLPSAREFCDADYRPPVQMGDVYRAACEKPRAIAIIDGLFERVPAVWHKEILFALAQGIEVFGGCSMGALRAAELDAFGMVGVGTVYGDFASGVLTDDDEVAVAHGSGEDGYVASSVAMVNLRSGCADAMRAGLLSDAEAAELIMRSKARLYPERTWEALFADASELLVASRCGELCAWIAETRPDRKRDDAVEVLKALVASRTAAPRHRTAFEFEHTVYWETVQTYCGQHGANHDGGHFERVRNHARLFERDREQLVDRALLLFLAEQDLRRMNVPQSDDRSALAAFRRRRGLESASAFVAWLECQRLSKPECLDLARLEARLGILRDRHMAVIDRYLVAQLKLEGRYVELAGRVGAKWQSIAGAALGRLDYDAGQMDDIIAWYQQRHGRIEDTLELHASRLGIGSLHQWREEVFAEYLATEQAAA